MIKTLILALSVIVIVLYCTCVLVARADKEIREFEASDRGDE